MCLCRQARPLFFFFPVCFGYFLHAVLQGWKVRANRPGKSTRISCEMGATSGGKKAGFGCRRWPVPWFRAEVANDGVDNPKFLIGY